MPEIITVLGATFGAAATTITIYDFLFREYSKNRARRQLAFAMALKNPEDLRVRLGDTVDQLWPYYKEMGYLPVDVMRRRQLDHPIVVPGPSLAESLAPIHKLLGNLLVPTRPIPVPRKILRLLQRRPGKVVRDIQPFENAERAVEPSAPGQSKVVFLHKGQPHIGSTQPTTLSDLLDIDDLSVPRPTPIALYPPRSRDRKLLQIKARSHSILGAEDYTVVLTRKSLQLLYRSRQRNVEIPRETILWLRLDESKERLEIGSIFRDFAPSSTVIAQKRHRRVR